MSYTDQSTRTTFLYNKIIKLKGQFGTKSTDSKCKEGDNEIWPTPLGATLEPSVKVIRWGILGDDIDVNKEALPEIWSKAPKSITHGPWLSNDWEIHVETLGTKDDWTKLFDFSLRYFWYFSSENLGSDFPNLDTCVVLLGKPYKEKQVS